MGKGKIMRRRADLEVFLATDSAKRCWIDDPMPTDPHLVKPQLKWGRLFLALIIAACIIVVGIAMTHRQIPPAPAPVIAMSKPYAMPATTLGLLDRAMPRGPSWAWLWKMRYAVFGKTRSIDLSSMIIVATDLDLSAVVLPTRPDLASENGVQVWRIKEADLKTLRQHLKEKPEQILASPRVTTGDRSQCSVYCGNSIVINGSAQQVGVSADLLPSIRKDTVDLTAVFCCSEPITNLAGAVSIRTNFDFGGRFQISRDVSGVFVLSAPTRSAEEKRIAVLLTSNVQRPKK